MAEFLNFLKKLGKICLSFFCILICGKVKDCVDKNENSPSIEPIQNENQDVKDYNSLDNEKRPRSNSKHPVRDVYTEKIIETIKNNSI